MTRFINIIQTQHSLEGAYSPDVLYRYIRGLDPDILFVESPVSEFEKFSKGDEFINQERLAVEKYLEEKKIPLKPVDLPYLNQDAHRLGLFQHKDFSNRLIWNNEVHNLISLEIIIEKIRKLWSYSDKRALEDGHSWLSCGKFRKLVCRINQLERKLFQRYDKINGTNHFQDYISSQFFHFDIREKAMAIGCLNGMEGFSNGVLLIGACHFGILKSLKNMNVDNKLSIRFFKGT